jgi:hypothetical protein
MVMSGRDGAINVYRRKRRELRVRRTEARRKINDWVLSIAPVAVVWPGRS